MESKELIKVLDRFTEQNDFKLNPDKSHVDMIVNGLLRNKQKYRLKLCPCRIRDGTRERDLELICPCNFKTDDAWKNKGMCWCGLFVRK